VLSNERLATLLGELRGHATLGSIEIVSVIEGLMAEVERLKNAIEWYANRWNYDEPTVEMGDSSLESGPSDVQEDQGERARNALAGKVLA